MAAAVTASALAEAMARLCEPAERARLAAGAREAGRALADWDAHAARLVGVLAGMLGRSVGKGFAGTRPGSLV